VKEYHLREFVFLEVSASSNVKEYHLREFVFLEVSAS
jgi:hypothetical protein